MRVVPINEAEAIIEPYWDGGSSEHPGDKRSLLDQYRVAIDPDARARVSQGWASVDVTIDRARQDRTAVTMTRTCDVDVRDYDIFRLFGAVPRSIRLKVTAVIDGNSRVLIDHCGADATDEFDGILQGAHLTELELSFTPSEACPAKMELRWLGLSNRAAQTRMEARKSPYTPDWPGALAPEPERLTPQSSILFDETELEALRTRVRQPPFRQVFEAMRREAEELLDAKPEADIGYLIPKPDGRWCRKRDIARKCTAQAMELLAFVGLVDNNAVMSRMAARMALSAAHCDTWCESIMGVFPGATWHHRSFAEEIYCRGCALVLDWAGAVITPHGQQIIRDAIIMKGLPRIESDFKRMEYIRHMNQGIVFSNGRIFGLLGVLPEYSRYASLIDEAERDLHEMIRNYVLPDGGTLEGMGYWNYTFSQVMPIIYALARRRGTSLQDYATEELRKTGDYALAMRSTIDKGDTYLAVNDAHNESRIKLSVAAAYCLLSDRHEWKDLYAGLLESSSVESDIFGLIIAPPPDDAPGPLVAPRFDVLPESGQVSSVRRAPGLGHIHFHLCSGPTYGGHFHADKGAFILEAAGEALAVDRGVTFYDHPETGLMGTAARHNLLYPEAPDGRLTHQPGNAAGGKLTQAVDRNGCLFLASDNVAAWEDGVFLTNTRRVVSPAPELYLFCDEVELTADWAVSFRVNSHLCMRVADGAAWIEGKRARLRIVPINWTPTAINITAEGIDDHLRPVNLLRLATDPSTSHRLMTAIEVVPPNGGARWEITATAAMRKDRSVTYNPATGCVFIEENS